MAKQPEKRYVVRLTSNNGPVNRLLECLRYAGVVWMPHPSSPLPEERSFDIPAPRGFDRLASYHWASNNAERMRTFGFKAVPVEEAL